MSASRRSPRSRFQPGIAAMYACTGAWPSAFAICGLPPERSLPGLASLPVGLAFFVSGPFRATAAFTSAWNAVASTCSPSWMSIALRVLPSRLELKRRDGSGMLAPRANVSLTTFVYISPVQTIPLCDQTGTPAIPFDGFLHLRSSVISGSASRISARMRARVPSRHPASRTSRDREAGFPAAPAFGEDVDLLADLRGLLARDAPIGF